MYKVHTRNQVPLVPGTWYCSGEVKKWSAVPGTEDESKKARRQGKQRKTNGSILLYVAAAMQQLPVVCSYCV